MHRGAIVPHHQIADLPDVGPQKLGTGRVLKKRLEKRVALIGGHIENIFGQMGTGIKRLAPGLWMGTHDRMVNALGWVLFLNIMAMHGSQSCEPFFHLFI